MLHKTQTTEVKRKGAFEILVNSEWYNNNEAYQKQIDEKLIETLKPNPLKDLFKSFGEQI